MLAKMPDLEAEQQAALAEFQENGVRRVLEALAECGNVVGAARLAGVAPRTIHYWMERNQQFRLECERAKELYGAKVTQHIHEAVLEGKHQETVNHPVLTIFHAKRYVPEYREKVELHHSVTVEDRLSPEQRRQLILLTTGMEEEEEEGEFSDAL